MNRTETMERLRDLNAEEFAAMMGRALRGEAPATEPPTPTAPTPTAPTPTAPPAPASLVVRCTDTPDTRTPAEQFAEMMGRRLTR